MPMGEMQPLPEPEENFVKWSAEFIVVDERLLAAAFQKVLAVIDVNWVIIRRQVHSSIMHQYLFYAFKRSEIKYISEHATASLADALKLQDEDASQLAKYRKPLPKRLPPQSILAPSRNRVIALDKNMEPRLIGEVQPPKPPGSKRLTYTIFSRPHYPMQAPPPRPLPKEERVVVRIFYATDRKRDELIASAVYLGDRCESETLELGTCDIAIPKNHQVGKLEIEKWWSFAFHGKDSFFELLDTSPSENEALFYAQLKACAANSAENDIFVFIHGFNVSFEKGALQTAQLAYDLGFKGAPILYSWPAGGNVINYGGDAESVNWSMPHLKAFLKDIKRRAGVGRINLIAHSMGNRAMARCLKEMSAEGMDEDFGLRQIIMAAPDIDLREFLQIAEQINGTAERITLYASAKDKALILSKTLHSGYSRAGEAGENMVLVDGIDTIDASNVDTSFLKHSYFSEKTVVSDICDLIPQGLAPALRNGLRAKRNAKREYWEFKT